MAAVSSKIRRIKNQNITLHPRPDKEGGGWYAEVPGIADCAGLGATQEEALQQVREAMAERSGVVRKVAKRLPKMSKPAKFVVRLPKSLHQRLVSAAEKEGVSLNTEVIQLLAEGVGRHAEEPESHLQATSIWKVETLKRKKLLKSNRGKKNLARPE